MGDGHSVPDTRRQSGSPIEQLIEEIRTEAQRTAFPVDEAIYSHAGLDPIQPILYAGRLQSRVCLMGRDLGKEEVGAREPLCGAAGLRVRRAIFRVLHHREARDQELQTILDHVLLTNIVPYKPPANSAYPRSVVERFRPFLERLLVHHWLGDQVITLGNEAFAWFVQYNADPPLTQLPPPPDRYAASTMVNIASRDTQGNLHHRQVTLRPLPHPSPLNVSYYARFPELLERRLAEAGLQRAPSP